MDIITEIEKVKKRTVFFLEHQESKIEKGYYRYSYSGDYYDERIFWNIPGTLFALDIAYVIQHELQYQKEAIAYLMQFRNKDGYVYSKYIRDRVLPKYIYSQLKKGRIDDLDCKKYKRAETRQIFRTLLAYNESITFMPRSEIRNTSQIVEYLNKLDWSKPWDAGSHLSHLIFYNKLGVRLGEVSEYNYNIANEGIVNFLEQLWDKKNGTWGHNVISSQQRINGAMKILTGIELLDDYEISIDQAISLIDFCLVAEHQQQACDNYNIIYIFSILRSIIGDYRKNEIIEFVENRFIKIMNCYYPDEGGFSFAHNQSNKKYYGFDICKGLNEPDMHGTRLYIWAICLISQILGIEKDVGLIRMVENV